ATSAVAVIEARPDSFGARRAPGGVWGAISGPPTYEHSSALKKYGISNAAVSGASEPCTALASIELANSLRMVPAAALAGSVAPMRSRHFWIALSASSTSGMHGPCVMNVQRLLKKGRCRWTAEKPAAP